MIQGKNEKSEKRVPGLRFILFICDQESDYIEA
jgi:hypothetical protein